MDYRGLRTLKKHRKRRSPKPLQEVWLVKGLKAAGLKAGQLAEVKGSDERKVLLADLLR